MNVIVYSRSINQSHMPSFCNCPFTLSRSVKDRGIPTFLGHHSNAAARQKARRWEEGEGRRSTGGPGDVWTMLMLLHWSLIVCFCLFLPLQALLPGPSLSSSTLCFSLLLPEASKLRLQILSLLSLLSVGHLEDVGIQGDPVEWSCILGDYRFRQKKSINFQIIISLLVKLLLWHTHTHTLTHYK